MLKFPVHAQSELQLQYRLNAQIHACAAQRASNSMTLQIIEEIEKLDHAL